MRSVDLLVVGAGPAGIAAAITAKGHGRSVLVVDKAEFPRDKFCGDGLTTECLRLLETLGLEPQKVTDWNAVTDVMIRSPRGREYMLPLPSSGGQFAAVVPRFHLDNALVELALDKGVEISQGCSVSAIEERPDRLVVRVDGLGDVHARYVIAADGMWSPTRKLMGAGQAAYLGEWHAFRQYFSNVGPRAQHLTVWFEPDLLPGYAWSFPLPGQRANVGFGILRGGSIPTRDMKTIWPDLLSRPHIREILGPNATPEAQHRAWPIPARVGRLPLSSGRALFVGDAAAAADPMTGEGIAQALLTGMLAANAVTDAGPFEPQRAADSYTEQVGKHLVTDHRMAGALGRILASSRGTELSLLAAGATDWTRRNFARWMFEDYPRAILATPRRWRRHMLTGDGAWTDRPEHAGEFSLDASLTSHGDQPSTTGHQPEQTS